MLDTRHLVPVDSHYLFESRQALTDLLGDVSNQLERSPLWLS